MKNGKITQAKQRILAALTVGFVMTFTSAVVAQPMTDHQVQNRQEDHGGHEGHKKKKRKGHQRHQRHQKDAMEAPVWNTPAI